MNTLTVHLAEKSYPIFLGPVAESGPSLDRFCAGRNVLFAADSNTRAWQRPVLDLIEKSAMHLECFTFPAGEASKTIDTVLRMIEQASRANFGRDALFIAFGGGVCGDMTGFAAAIYMRGIPFIQIPTSLLAMVDSSIGGKTAVDTVFGKNLIGAFHQPLAVYIDTDFLKTLPERQFRNGMAEIIKAGVLGAPELYRMLEQTSMEKLRADRTLLETAVFQACDLKRRIVEQDECETHNSIRVRLNYGHTFGHAVELLSGFSLNHGESVAIGMDMAAQYAFEEGLCSREFLLSQRGLLQRYGFDLNAGNGLSPEEILRAMFHDKKNRHGKIRVILPESVGTVLVQEIPDPKKLEMFLRKYLAEVRS